MCPIQQIGRLIAKRGLCWVSERLPTYNKAKQIAVCLAAGLSGAGSYRKERVMDGPLCQLACWPALASGHASMAGRSLSMRVKLFLKRRLSTGTKRALKKRYLRMINRVTRAQTPPPAVRSTSVETSPLQAGDWVRVRSREEIEATLNAWGELKGCGFMAEMAPYCGTTQRVLKPVRQFMDERDYQLKRCNGIVLLENAICQGRAEYGPCDRSCFYFWREEWLEKVI